MCGNSTFGFRLLCDFRRHKFERSLNNTLIAEFYLQFNSMIYISVYFKVLFKEYFILITDDIYLVMKDM